MVRSIDPQIVTAFDRASRCLLVAELLEGYGASAALAGLVELFDWVAQQVRRILMWGQGGEIACWSGFEQLSEISCLHSRASLAVATTTNENGSCLVRRCVGKAPTLTGSNRMS